MNDKSYNTLHFQAQYLIMKVLRGDARGGMPSIDSRSGRTIQGYAGSTINAPVGEFWFARDGVLPHLNNKAKLPVGGSYLEYTVSKMEVNSQDYVPSGPERIVHRTDKDREFYYTPDHYKTFFRVSDIPPTEDTKNMGRDFEMSPLPIAMKALCCGYSANNASLRLFRLF